ncbi:hypothetical protein [Labilibaculum manganireducens]|uniref:M61 family metallopeptidase n=1 Tax=Labilibaculum manganireducens TaxID=1940525 RepID=UPI0029F4ABF3|nr:hypothetical protein [Labilibaculum manganireducens]
MHRLKIRWLRISCIAILIAAANPVAAQSVKPVFEYIVSVPEPSSHVYHVELHTLGWDQDTVVFKMPKWMPGYYQIMDYAKSIKNITAHDDEGNKIFITSRNENSWSIGGIKNKSIILSYDIKTDKKFVANSFVDESHAYIVPENSFMYADGFLELPVSVKVEMNSKWKDIATGLMVIKGHPFEFAASNFDILYDSPLLIGNLEELPAFKIKGIEHRFIGYDIGSFDKIRFMNNLKKVVESAINIIGDIPYDRYTFIGIGPGQGGIEHLNNTVVSFNGNKLNSEKAEHSMMNFLAHEYFHNYNVKRIRPCELGPFNYDKENRTNQLWVSEGLTVYYEYLILKRAGFGDTKTMFSDLEANINTVENNPGRFYQTLAQASYNTWEDGPFGGQGEKINKSVSYYQKGPVVGLLLDFAIRNSTRNKKSLDDVMKLVYWEYYKNSNRGFTDAEFQQACETIAGKSLNSVFDYIYTTKELEYNTYLNYAGLRLDLKLNSQQEKKYTLNRISKPNLLQQEILRSWLQETN